jgi:UDP-glucuronate 4-epimerase
MSRNRVLVTGSNGCIGAWVVKHLIDDGVDVVAADVGSSAHRLEALIDPEALAGLERISLDIGDRAAVDDAIRAGGFDSIIHLAALQVPFCRADPSLGAQVNVVGTINLVEAFRASDAARGPFVYASSIAAYDPDDSGETDPSGRPRTLYGVYKLATEQALAVYADDHDVASVGLRPHVVYGVGRDQGMTSSPTFAMLHAAAGQGSSISYSGKSQLQFADDVARSFVAAASADVTGAHVFNLGGESVDMSEVVHEIERCVPEVRGAIRIEGDPLPFPAAASDDGLARVIGATPHTSLADGIEATIDRFRNLLSAGLVTVPEEG